MNTFSPDINSKSHRHPEESLNSSFPSTFIGLSLCLSFVLPPHKTWASSREMRAEGGGRGEEVGPLGFLLSPLPSFCLCGPPVYSFSSCFLSLVSLFLTSLSLSLSLFVLCLPELLFFFVSLSLALVFG